MWPPHDWATHQKFFHKVSRNFITMYPAVYLMSSLRVCGKIEPHWGYIMISLKWTHWAHCGHISRWFVKELMMSGSAIWLTTFWLTFWKKPLETFKMCPMVTWLISFWMYSQSTHQSHCDQIDGYFVKEISIWLLATFWVNCLKNHNVITMYLLGKTPPAPSAWAQCVSPRQTISSWLRGWQISNRVVRASPL